MKTPRIYTEGKTGRHPVPLVGSGRGRAGQRGLQDPHTGGDGEQGL